MTLDGVCRVEGRQVRKKSLRPLILSPSCCINFCSYQRRSPRRHGERHCTHLERRRRAARTKKEQVSSYFTSDNRVLLSGKSGLSMNLLELACHGKPSASARRARYGSIFIDYQTG